MGMKQPRFSWIVPGQNWQLDHETAVGNLCFQAEFVDFEFVATKFPQKKVTTVWYIPVSWNKLTQDWFKYTYFILFLVVISKTNFFFHSKHFWEMSKHLGIFSKKTRAVEEFRLTDLLHEKHREVEDLQSLPSPSKLKAWNEERFFWGSWIMLLLLLLFCLAVELHWVVCGLN